MLVRRIVFVVGRGVVVFKLFGWASLEESGGMVGFRVLGGIWGLKGSVEG